MIEKFLLRLIKFNRVLGIELTQEEVVSILERLCFMVKIEKNGTLVVTVPTRRTDIYITEDLIEEVGRIYGIDRIKGKKMILPVVSGNVDRKKRYIRNKLADLGLNETLSYALIPERDVKLFTNDEFDLVKVLDPMSEERTTLRYSLLSSLMDVYQYNKARGQKDISIFEIGKVCGC